MATPTCASCVFGAVSTALLSFSYSAIETITVSVTPHITLYQDGSRSTSYESNTQSITEIVGSGDRNASKTFDNIQSITWNVGDATLTYPTTYIQYLGFEGAVATTQNGQTCAQPGDATAISLPANTDAASFIYPLGVLTGAMQLPTPLLDYLGTLDVIAGGSNGDTLAACAPLDSPSLNARDELSPHQRHFERARRDGAGASTLGSNTTVSGISTTTTTSPSSLSIMTISPSRYSGSTTGLSSPSSSTTSVLPGQSGGSGSHTPSATSAFSSIFPSQNSSTTSQVALTTSSAIMNSKSTRPPTNGTAFGTGSAPRFGNLTATFSSATNHPRPLTAFSGSRLHSPGGTLAGTLQPPAYTHQTAFGILPITGSPIIVSADGSPAQTGNGNPNNGNAGNGNPSKGSGGGNTNPAGGGSSGGSGNSGGQPAGGNGNGGSGGSGGPSGSQGGSQGGGSSGNQGAGKAGSGSSSGSQSGGGSGNSGSSSPNSGHGQAGGHANAGSNGSGGGNGGGQITADAGGGGVVLGTHTMQPGQKLTIGSGNSKTTLAVQTKGGTTHLIVDGTTYNPGPGGRMTPNSVDPTITSPHAVITAGGETITAARSGNSIIFQDGHSTATLRAGGVATFDGQTISALAHGSSIVINGKTTYLAGTASPEAIMTAAGHIFTAIEEKGFVLLEDASSTAFVPNGAKITFEGQTVSAMPGGTAVVVNGRTITLSVATTGTSGYITSGLAGPSSPTSGSVLPAQSSSSSRWRPDCLTRCGILLTISFVFGVLAL